MSCLGPLAPVSGSEAARRRRAQLRTQLPPHDVAPAARHHASDQEKSEHTVSIFYYVTLLNLRLGPRSFVLYRDKFLSIDAVALELLVYGTIYLDTREQSGRCIELRVPA